MRLALKVGTNGIVSRIAAAIAGGLTDGSLAPKTAPTHLAAALYDLWLGASVMANIVRNQTPFDTALNTTPHLMGVAVR